MVAGGNMILRRQFSFGKTSFSVGAPSDTAFCLTLSLGKNGFFRVHHGGPHEPLWPLQGAGGDIPTNAALHQQLPGGGVANTKHPAMQSISSFYKIHIGMLSPPIAFPSVLPRPP